MKFFKKIKNKYKAIEWKIYFFIFVFSYSHFFIYIWTDFSFLKLTKFIILVLLILAFFGFAWEKRIFTRFFWKVVFIFITPWQIGSLINFLISKNLWSQLDFSFIFSLIMVIITITFLKIVPLMTLYLYAFKNENIWRKIKENNNKKI